MTWGYIKKQLNTKLGGFPNTCGIQINQQTRGNSFSSLLLDVYLQLNMFRPSSRPWSGPRPTALLSPRSEGKTRGCYCSCWAPDHGREDARNMLSCKLTSSDELENLMQVVGWFIWTVWWCTDVQTLNVWNSEGEHLFEWHEKKRMTARNTDGKLLFLRANAINTRN